MMYRLQTVSTAPAAGGPELARVKGADAAHAAAVRLLSERADLWTIDIVEEPVNEVWMRVGRADVPPRPWLADMPPRWQLDWMHHTACWHGDTLVWRAADTIINGVVYHLLPPQLGAAWTLLVCGDLWEAVYQWHSAVSLQAIAGFGLAYFAEKCVASETGRGFQQWDPSRAAEAMREAIADWEAETPAEERSADAIEIVASFRQGHGPGEDLAGYETFARWLQDTDGLEDILGVDRWEWASCGYRPHPRCEAHLLGLRAAMGWLAAHPWSHRWTPPWRRRRKTKCLKKLMEEYGDAART